MAASAVEKNGCVHCSTDNIILLSFNWLCVERVGVWMVEKRDGGGKRC